MGTADGVVFNKPSSIAFWHAFSLGCSERIAAKVPFEFVLGNKVVPAGDWTVQSGNMSSSVLQIRNTDARVNMFAMPSAIASKTR